MIKPMLYFDMVPNGDLFLRALAKRTTRANNLCGFFPEVKKVLTAIMLRYPMTHILTADEYRSHPTESLVFDYHEGSTVVVNYPRRAKGLDRIPLQVTSYTTAQIARQIRASIDHLADAETAVDAMLLGRMTREGEVARARLQLHYPELARNARQQLEYLQERNNMIFSAEQIAAMDPATYKANRKYIMDPRYRAEVQTQVDAARRVERQEAIDRDPEGYKLRGLQQQRDDAAKRGRNTAGIDATIEEITKQKAARGHSASFQSSPDYISMMEITDRLRPVVAKYDPDAMSQVDCAVLRFREHKNSDLYHTELTRASQTAWLAEIKAGRDAEHDSLLQTAELARADYERVAAQHANSDIDALMDGGAQ